jgi:Ca-activated chloride channel family protein
MKKNLIIVLIAAVCFGFSTAAAQSSRPVQSEEIKKANRRPPEKPSVKTEKTPVEEPVFEDEVIDDDDDVIEISTEVVTFPVKVTDRKGKFVPGLQKENFKVFENGVEQPIEFFSNEQQPFTVALVLDMSYSSNFKISEIQQAAIDFIDQLRPEDKVMVVAFDEEVQILSEPTGDRQKLYGAIMKTKIGSGTSLYGAVNFVVNQRLRKISGRKAIVLFTDGVDTTSYSIGPNQTLRDIEELDVLVFPIRYDTFADVQRMKNQPVIIPPTRPSPIPTSTPNPLPFPIPTGGVGTPGGQGTSIEDYRRAEQYLNDLANRTGGRVYEASTTGYLRRAFSSIASELREFYSIGYYLPEGAAEGERRRIKVKVDRENVSVAARDHYTVGKKAKKKGAR